MKKTILKSFITLALLSTTSLYATDTHESKHWGYLSEVSPSHWGELKKEFKACSEGKQQSPINVVSTKDVKLMPLGINYTSGSKSIINNGHTIQINVKDGSYVEVDGKKYQLKQFHFHVPSENNINGKKFPLETHFVHKSDDGKLAVIAVMFNEDKSNPILEKAWKKIPKVNEEEKLNLTAKEITSLLPENKDYYTFMGSLTTPPCTEGVKWIVLKTPQSLSKKQVNTFFNTFSFPNNRPIQSRNKREIKE